MGQPGTLVREYRDLGGKFSANALIEAPRVPFSGIEAPRVLFNGIEAPRVLFNGRQRLTCAVTAGSSALLPALGRVCCSLKLRTSICERTAGPHMVSLG